MISPGVDPLPTADTAPQEAVDLPASSAAGRADGDVSSVLLIRAVVAGVAAVLLLAIAVVLFRNGVRPNRFPPYVAGVERTFITRYSGPWIGGAAGVAVLAGLSFVSFGVDLFRRIRLQRTDRP